MANGGMVADVQLEIPTLQPPVKRSSTDMEALIRLASYVDSGLTGRELMIVLAKLVKCQCGLIMLKKVFDGHRCTSRQTVIDLTADDDDTEPEL